MREEAALADMKEELAGFMRRLYRQRLTTTSGGNISMRCGDNILITPSGTDKGRLQAAEIGIMDITGNLSGNRFTPSIESEIHLEIYRRYQSVQAVVHAHPLATSAFAASAAELKCSYHAEAKVILGTIGYVDYYCPGSPELALEVAKTVAEHNCVLMRNHGALCVGKSLLQAFDRLEVLEMTANINLIMRQALRNEAVELSCKALRELEKFE